MKLPKFLLAFLALFGCAGGFKDTTTPAGIPNLVQFAPKMWRMGQPPDEAAWKELAATIAPNGEQVIVYKLNDDKEGDDSPAEKIPGWSVVKATMPPEDDKPWSVFLKPDPQEVRHVIAAIETAHAKGFIIVIHCTHGRDRTSLVTSLVERDLFHWTKDQAWDDMIKHGFRWELPDLTAYWVEDVPGVKKD